MQLFQLSFADSKRFADRNSKFPAADDLASARDSWGNPYSMAINSAIQQICSSKTRSDVL